MSREAIRKLLGGYATGTLTAEEQRALFEAALDDQELFDALARDQSLRDLLRDPATRAHLLAALDDAPAPWHQRLGRWMWGHAVGLAAVACFLAMGGYVVRMAKFTPERVVVVATEPTRVEVNGSAENQAKPSRVFDIRSAQKAAPPIALELPPPPAIAQRTPTLRLPLAPYAPQIPRPPAAQAEFLAAARGGGGGGGGGLRQTFQAGGMTAVGASSDVTAPAAVSGGLALPNVTTEVSVTAMATPVQTTGSENSKLVDSAQIANLTLKGRDMFAVLETVPGVYVGNAYRTAGDAASESTAVQNMQINGGGTGKASFQVDGITDLDAGSNPTTHFEPNMDSVAGVATLRAMPASGRLDPALVALARHVRSGAKPTAEETRLVSGGQVHVRLTVANASPDTLGQLKKAGLTITGRQRNEVAGHIPIEKLEALARFAFVVWIAPR